MYIKGRADRANDPGAARWLFQLAADQGHAGAQYTLGMMYARGQGTSQDSVAALTWLSLATTQNAPAANHILYEKELKELVEQMTAEQVVTANRQVLEWLQSQQRQPN